MAVSEVIASMQENLANAYASAETKNATMPEQKNLANLSATIDSITTGGASGEQNFNKYNIVQTENEDGTINLEITDYEGQTDNNYLVGQIIYGKECSLYIVNE